MCDCFPAWTEGKELKQEDVQTWTSSNWLLLQSHKDCLYNIPTQLDIEFIMEHIYIYILILKTIIKKEEEEAVPTALEKQ